MNVRKHVIYSGRVQGVGFRWTAQQLAEEGAVGGHVRNLPDGTVELAVEGSTEQVEALLAALARRLAGYIARSQITDEPPRGSSDFQIRH